MAGWFADKWEKWILEDEQHNLDVELQLDAAYRSAWATGNNDDRYAILCFIEQRRDPRGVDLVIEALRSSDPRLSREAAAIAAIFIAGSFDMGPTIRKDLEDFGKRFPKEDAISIAALRLLDRTEGRRK